MQPEILELLRSQWPLPPTLAATTSQHAVGVCDNSPVGKVYFTLEEAEALLRQGLDLHGVGMVFRQDLEWLDCGSRAHHGADRLATEGARQHAVSPETVRLIQSRMILAKSVQSMMA